MSIDGTVCIAIAALDEKRGLGRDGDLPWHIPADLKHFAETTKLANHPDRKNAVIMGRLTCDSIPDKYWPLTGRNNFVVTRQKLSEYRGVPAYSSLQAALKAARQTSATLYIVGGGQIYSEALKLPECQELILTQIYKDFECDAFFPEFDSSFVKSEVLAEDMQHNPPYRIERWERTSEKSLQTEIENLAKKWSAMSPGKADGGKVFTIVTRASSRDLPKGHDKARNPRHSQPEEVALTPEEGVVGDRWKKGMAVGDQVTLINAGICQLIAGEASRWHLFGNNFVVDLDLSAANLPLGTRLQIGTAVIEISGEPHEPCDRYAARFGKAAHDWVMASPEKEHLRGRKALVLSPGKVQLGDCIGKIPNDSSL